MTSDAPYSSRARILWSFARPHRGKLALGLVLGLVGSAGGLAAPMVTKWVLDALAASDSLAWPVAALLGLAVVGAAVSWYQWTLLGSLGERVVLDARRAIVTRYLGATVPALTARPSGELVTRATSDTVLLREAASSSVVGLINGTVMLIGTLVLMGVLDLVLLATTIGAVVIVGILFALLMPGIAVAQERSQEHIGRLGGVLEGAVRAIRTVKASQAEERLSRQILTEAEASAEHSIRAVRREALAWSIAWTGVQLAIVLILSIGAWRVSEGQLEVSSLIAFLLYAFGLMEPISELTEETTTLQAGIAAAGRIREVEQLELERDERVARPELAVSPTRSGASAPPILELRDVSAAYGPGLPRAVDRVSLTIPRRGHVAIVGPSGAGKTTLLSLLLRFLEPQGGELRLAGTPYSALTHAQVRERFAYVEQDTPVVPGTIGDNLRFSHPQADEDELRRVLAAVRLDDPASGIAGRLDEPLANGSVSGGQRQRIALARAILRNPEVLLLDEATAQLDGLTEASIHASVRRQAEQGAVVTVAHRLSTVVDADVIVVMEAGRIRTRGTHSELLARDPLYQRLVEALRLDRPAQEPASAPATS
ncbi:ABC transporter ATP-binding protein [Conexibacter woesei]|uniref:ABC transporter related protein n=1 Tax=Conexibacter woesei (strain DSM 14684 / CCUG 47730 / CIP 108061 / JCM 11494 / NBRC 100937 / ID131577) TaxID=469383 RepID=D3FDB0_CONWI|nr:ABC transporter ATP-binding protein [Conexibacter woesei]ADB53502.1 ABC transporter related protein [Conexibacter woesei DSM 14684]